MSHVTALASWDSERQKLVFDDRMLLHAGFKRLKPQAGERFVIRVEREEEAWRWSDVKHLYGHLYKPVSRRTGETEAEVHLRMKVNFFPEDGRTSLTQLNREEMKAFTESVEQDIRENDPDSWEDCVAAMALYEQRAQLRRPA